MRCVLESRSHKDQELLSVRGGGWLLSGPIVSALAECLLILLVPLHFVAVHWL